MNLSTISHGLWLVFSLPFNLVATIPAAIAENNSYKLHWNGLGWWQTETTASTKVPQKKHSVSLEQAKMYARFPQGIPEGIMPEMK